MTSDFDDLIAVGKAATQKLNQAKPGVKKGKKSKNPKAKTPVDTSKLQRVLTEDPYETLGVELHVSVTRCAHCGTEHRSPLPGTNTLNRRVKRRTGRTIKERIVGGPFPWIATSVPQSDAELEAWRQHEVEHEADRLGVQTIEHRFTAARCEACTHETEIPDHTDQLRLGLLSPKKPSPSRRNVKDRIPLLPNYPEVVWNGQAMHARVALANQRRAVDHFWARLAQTALEDV
jgi:hypothetical protein